MCSTITTNWDTLEGKACINNMLKKQALLSSLSTCTNTEAIFMFVQLQSQTMRDKVMPLHRTWSALKRAVILALCPTTQVIQWIRVTVSGTPNRQGGIRLSVWQPIVSVTCDRLYGLRRHCSLQPSVLHATLSVALKWRVV